MRLLEGSRGVETLRAAIDARARCDYLYMYPPRQAYRPFERGVDPAEMVAQSLAGADRVNLYVHVPFCRQICAYCNLYAVGSRSDRHHRRYVDAVLAELAAAAPLLAGKTVRTLYVGGGTPSLLDPPLLAELLSGTAEVVGFALGQVAEVAIEVAPDTASPERLAQLRSAGFTRMNLGVQSADDGELLAIGRRYAEGTVGHAMQAAVAAGFANVCVDLIYGLPGQTATAWRRSLEAVIQHRPETICAYALTLRSGTGLDRRSYRTLDDVEQYRRYDIADEMLRAAGYEQQTHVRWALPGRGGYLQKEYHWACEPLFGVGAGARSYLFHIDCRNGYSLHRRVTALEDYLARIEAGRNTYTDGFVMDQDERMRKAVILGLNDLDTAAFEATYGIDPVDAFPKAFEALIELGLLNVTGDHLRLSGQGVRHRDVVVQPFVSPRVRQLVNSFSYEE